MSKVGIIARAATTVAAVSVLAGGVTFAALQDTATLTDNTITTATASLKLWDGDSFEDTAPGFQVTNLIPGTGSGPQKFYFENDSDSSLTVTAHVPTAPAEPEGGYGFTGWENLKVKITNLNNGEPVETTMADLLSGDVVLPGDPLTAHAQGNSAAGSETTEGNYSMEFDIAPESVTGDHAGVGNFNIVFTGTATAPTPSTPPTETPTPPAGG